VPGDTIPDYKSEGDLQAQRHFIGQPGGHAMPLDADPLVSAQDLGPKPKGLVLTALAGCTGTNVISILPKSCEHSEARRSNDAHIGRGA
jgi:uncharacterized OsmC-like protein